MEQFKDNLIQINKNKNKFCLSTKKCNREIKEGRESRLTSTPLFKRFYGFRKCDGITPRRAALRNR